jgi:two-component system, LuxR family, sensor kinase FixL
MSTIDGKAPSPATTGEVDDRLFRLHFDNLPGPAFLWQRDGEDFRLIAYNRAGALVGARDVDSVLGTSASELYADRPDILAHIKSSADDGVALRRETDFRFRDGSAHTLAVTCVPLSRDTVVAHVDDVTEERAAARALAESEGRMRALFASNPDVVYRMDADARFLDVHVPEATYFPWSREELIGRTVGAFYGEEAQKQQVRHNLEAIRTGKVQVFEYRIPVGDVVMTCESRVASAGGNEVVVTVRDISDRVELERKLTLIGERERNDIGREIHDGLAQMLTGVKLLLEYLEKRLREEGSPHAGAAGLATEHVNTTISHARELVRGLSPIPQGTTLFHALELLASHATKYLGVSCPTSFTGDPSGLHEVAVAHLYRIAQEAVTNAVRHGAAAEIQIGCRISDNVLVLDVADAGSGFDEPGDSAAGLGLKIMRHRARALGGEVTVTRRPQGGTLVACTCHVRTLLN